MCPYGREETSVYSFLAVFYSSAQFFRSLRSKKERIIYVVCIVFRGDQLPFLYLVTGNWAVTSSLVTGEVKSYKLPGNW